jgi:hypothetical protein
VRFNNTEGEVALLPGSYGADENIVLGNPAQLSFYEVGGVKTLSTTSRLVEVGKAKRRFPRAKVIEPQGTAEIYREFYPSLNHPDAISVIFQRYQERVIPPSKSSFTFGDRRIIDFLQRKYFVVEENYESFFDREDGDVLLRSAYEAAWAKVDLTKTPGSPLVYKAARNADVKKTVDEEVFQIVNHRLLNIEKLGKLVWENQSFESTEDQNIVEAMDLVKNGIADCVLVGPKGEPRAIENGVKKPPRLVSQVSLITNLVARLITGNHLLEEQTHDNLPTATQLDITTQEKTEARRAKYERIGTLSSNDIQGWEYSVCEADRWATCTKELYCMGLMDENWVLNPKKLRHAYAVIGYNYMLIHRVVQTPDGYLYVPRAGQMSSGDLGTFSQNSFCRAWISELVSLDTVGHPVEFVQTGGDDCLDTNRENFGAHMAYGKKVTDYEEQCGEYTFCSTYFGRAGSYQQNIKKTTYAVLTKGFFDEEGQVAFLQCFRNHPDFEKYYNLVCVLPRSREEAKASVVASQ